MPEKNCNDGVFSNMTDNKLGWDIQQRTSQGWETVNCEATLSEAKKSVKEYRENQPEFPVRIRRERKEK